MISLTFQNYFCIMIEIYNALPLRFSSNEASKKMKISPIISCPNCRRRQYSIITSICFNCNICST